MNEPAKQYNMGLITFEEMVAKVMRDTAKRFPEHYDFRCAITAEPGRDGIKVEYVFGSHYDEHGITKGSNFERTLTEYLRRIGWDKDNKALALLEPPKLSEELRDEIPF